MTGLLASALTDSSREALSIAAMILVTLVLGMLIQGRVVDEHVHPPFAWRARLGAVEILAAGIFFFAAFGGVYICVSSLALDRQPGAGDRARVESALLTTAIVAFLLTIGRRALPLLWPPPHEGRPPKELAQARWGVAVSTAACLISLSLAVILDTPRLLLVVTGFGALIVLGMIGLSATQSRLIEREGWRARRLSRPACKRIALCPVQDGPLAGASSLPPAFVPLTERSPQTRMWMSRAGLLRLGQALDACRATAPNTPKLRWQGRGRAELIWPRDEVIDHSYVADVTVLHRTNTKLFLVGDGLGLVECAPEFHEPPPLGSGGSSDTHQEE